MYLSIFYVLSLYTNRHYIKIFFFSFSIFKTSAKSKSNSAESKPPTCKKLKIFEVRPLVPPNAGERFDEGANSKKLGCYVGK